MVVGLGQSATIRRRRGERGWQAIEKTMEARRTRRRRFGRRTSATRRPFSVLAWASGSIWYSPGVRWMWLTDGRQRGAKVTWPTKTHLALDGLSFFQRYGFTYVNQYTSFISRINYEIVNKPIGCNYFVHMALNYFCARDNKLGNWSMHGCASILYGKKCTHILLWKIWKCIQKKVISILLLTKIHEIFFHRK